MPDINGKKIPELDPLPEGVEPSFLVSSPEGKGYNMTQERIIKIFHKTVVDGDTLPVANDLNSVTDPGIYILNQASFSSGVYQNAHYIPGVMLTSDVVLSVEVFSTGDIIQRLYWPFEGGESVRRKVLNNASWAHGAQWTKWEHWGGVYWIDGGNEAFKLAGGLDCVKTFGTYIVNVGLSSAAQLAGINLPNPNNTSSNSYRGSIYLTVKGRNNYEGDKENYASQEIEFVRSFFQDNYTNALDRSYRWKRRYNIDLDNGAARPENSWSDWLCDIPTLQGTSKNGFTSADKTLIAGTTTIPALAFTPGVQKQTTPVPNSFNTDGLNLFFTDKNGATYKLTMTAI